MPADRHSAEAGRSEIEPARAAVMPNCRRTAAISQRQRQSFASFQRRRTLSRWRLARRCRTHATGAKSDKSISSAWFADVDAWHRAVVCASRMAKDITGELNILADAAGLFIPAQRHHCVCGTAPGPRAGRSVLRKTCGDAPHLDLPDACYGVIRG